MTSSVFMVFLPRLTSQRYKNTEKSPSTITDLYVKICIALFSGHKYGGRKGFEITVVRVKTTNSSKQCKATDSFNDKGCFVTKYEGIRSF